MNSKRHYLWIGILLFIVQYATFAKTVTAHEKNIHADSIDSSRIKCEYEMDWHILLEEMAENGMDVEQWEERLTDLAANPIPLNSASREMLESIPILNPDLVENLSYYLYRYGPMVSLSELMLVDGMDAQRMRWLKPFVQIGTVAESPVEVPPMKKAFMYGKHEFRWSVGTTFQQKLGYDLHTDSSSHYLGDPLQSSVRYGFNYKNQLQWGIVIQKDPGEKWWNDAGGGFDFVSYHFLVKDSKKRNAALLGDYTVHFGQGLASGNAFSLGKNTSGVIPEQTGAPVSRHFSTSENIFFRGAVLRLTLKQFQMERKNSFGMELIPFLSIRKLDSHVENGIFESITATGLHRTPSELEGRNRLKQTVVGGHFSIRNATLSGGVTALTWLFNARPAAPSETWKVFQFTGNRGGNIAADWRMIIRGILLYGEGALDQNGHSAFIFGASFKPYPRMAISLLGRKYSPSYVALFGNGFSEGTATKNEEGIFASTDIQLAKRLHLSGYFDLFRFPWMSHGVNTPSWGQDFAVELSTTFGRNGAVKLIVKNKKKQKYATTFNFPTHPTLEYTKKQGRLQIDQKYGIWSMKTTILTNLYVFGCEKSNGIALAQDVGMESYDKRFGLFVHAVLFNTDTWENRIYLWEKDLPGAFSMPMLYGHGTRLALFAKYDFGNFRLQVKVADSVLPGMETIGDGLESMKGSRKTEARIQLSWKI